MPSNQPPLGALPARFRRARILIVGCGDVGLRVVRALPTSVRVLALTSSPDRVDELRSRQIVPLVGNLDDRRSLARLAGLAQRVVHLAPPGDALPTQDPRTAALLRALTTRVPPRALVYASTTGVYGHCHGERVVETRAPAPQTARARRRVDAERQVRHFGRRTGATACILRIPGIYAPDRPGGTPRDRLLRGTPVLNEAEDVFTNHIHADDLARAVVAALWRGRPQRAYNVNDDSEWKMGDYFDIAADHYGLPRPPRVSREKAAEVLTPMLLSFMGESRRLVNRRMKAELRLRLRHARPFSALA